ncbi:hypothetical protein D3C87_1069510 [compost metagenome]
MIRIVQAEPASVSNTIISICGRSSARFDSPLMLLTISSMPTTDSTIASTVVAPSNDRNGSTTPETRSGPLRLYSPNNATPNNSSKSTYNENRRTMLAESLITHFTLKVTLPVIGWVSDDTARHSTL